MLEMNDGHPTLLKPVSKLVLFLLLSVLSYAQVITTVAGGFIGDNGDATSAGLDFPRYVIQDRMGNTYLSDCFNHRIRKITAAGTITTFAGTGIAGFSGDGGPAKNAELSFPTGIVFDREGNMLVADSGNNRIRSIKPSGIITTIAGTGIAGYSGDNGPAVQAELNTPWGLAVDGAGDLFLADVVNNAIRRIDAFGTITTVAGNGMAGYSGDGGPATIAELNSPRSVIVDSHGNLYIADNLNHRVRKVDARGIINTFAGDGGAGFSGDGGLATEAQVGSPRGLLIDHNQLLISGGGGPRIRSVNLQTNIIETLAGSGLGYDGDGSLSGALFNGPTGMFLRPDGTLLLADQYNARLRSITSTSVSTVAGSFGHDNVRATRGLLIAPENLAIDSAGNYYIAEFGGNRIRRVDAATGRITTIAGTGITGYDGDGGPAQQARIGIPEGVGVDESGNVFISDSGNSLIRKVDTSGIISTFATDPNFSDLISLAIDSTGNLYVADDFSCVIFKVTPVGSVSVVAGNFTCGYNGDNIPATAAELNAPYGVAVDGRGNIYIGDTLNNRIRRVNRSGLISTVAGNGTCGFSGDGGPSIAALICTPENLAVDSSGSIYFCDYTNLRVRKISGGIIKTIAGSGNYGYNGEDLPALSTNLDGPAAVAIGHDGSVYILDDIQARVRKVH